jgi:plasmid stabilization system protein ParE
VKVTARPLANEHLEAAFDYYEGQLAGLGRRFLHEYRRGLEKIALFPSAWATVDDLTRRYQLDRFPYGILYIVDSDEVIVTAVVHLESDPKSWPLD